MSSLHTMERSRINDLLAGMSKKEIRSIFYGLYLIAIFTFFGCGGMMETPESGGDCVNTGRQTYSVVGNGSAKMTVSVNPSVPSVSVTTSTNQDGGSASCYSAPPRVNPSTSTTSYSTSCQIEEDIYGQVDVRITDAGCIENATENIYNGKMPQ